MVYFETERLKFRNWKESDLPFLIEMGADESVMRYFPSTLTKDESISFYNRIHDEFKESGYSLYAAELKVEHDFIGFIGFHRATFEADFTPCIEITWRLRKEFWHQGYATEGAERCLEYGFNTFGFDKVYSFTAMINIPSEHVMQRIGMQKVNSFFHPNVDKENPLCEHVLYIAKRKLP